jgi:hypothetical protein
VSMTYMKSRDYVGDTRPDSTSDFKCVTPVIVQ